ncbi:hypothetical protein EV426DRAFT_552060 [Tirmania nivea]|nr:hypothetical protein EV426DRAFT_552060 [Tirmania nivea]
MRLLHRVSRLGLLWSAASTPDKRGIPPIFRFAASCQSNNASLFKAIVEHSTADELLMVTDSVGRNILDVTLYRQHRETIAAHVGMGRSLAVEQEPNPGGSGVCKRVIRGNGVSSAFSCDGRGDNCKGVLEGFFYHCRDCCIETRAGFDLCSECYRADETLCRGGRAHRENFEKLFTQHGLISQSVYSPWIEEQKTPAQLKALTPENKRRKPQAQPLTKTQLLQPREPRRRKRSVAGASPGAGDNK